MTELCNIKKERSEESFLNVEALYQVLNENRANLRVRRAKINTNGEVNAEALDFLCDVEVRAKDALDPVDYAMFIRLVYLGQAKLFPEHLQILLGNEFIKYGLGVGGAYRALYFRVKNDQERAYMQEKANGEYDEKPD